MTRLENGTSIPPLLGVTGWKNSGKTRMVAALVREFTQRGYTVSTIKHAHHSFDVDQEGTDSWQHRQAGAQEVALVSGRRWAIMHELSEDPEPPLGEIVPMLSPCDLIMVEGYKRDHHPKIEMLRQSSSKDDPLWPKDDSIIALVTDMRLSESHLPQYTHDEISDIADFAIKYLKLKKPNDRK